LPTDAATLVLTVTPNPSLDLLFECDRLVWDDANRMADPRRRPGGQGINVTRAVRSLGETSTAVALLGGATGDEIDAALHGEAAPLRAVRASGETRTFVAVRELETGRSLLLNARGPARSPGDVERLSAAIADALVQLRPRWLACCGSLPAGFPADFYARTARLAREHGVRVVVDCDGEPLRLAASGCDLLVPNQHEAGRLLDTTVRDVSDAAAAARRLARNGDTLAAVTLGAHGAMIARGNECWHARAPELTSGSAVGAGDAFLAGLLAALDTGDGAPGRPGPLETAPPGTAGLPDALGAALRYAVAAGAATLLGSGAALLERSAVEALTGRVELVRI
jgi:1-phosphofructokinase family hexose kinase